MALEASIKAAIHAHAQVEMFSSKQRLNMWYFERLSTLLKKAKKKKKKSRLLIGTIIYM